MATAALPLFHLYGDPPDDQAFDFIHIETIASRSSIHDWTIRAHRHRNLFQILVIERGGGEMTFEAATIPFAAPCAHPRARDHRARFPLPAGGDRRLGDELHRGRRRGDGRPARRSAGAPQGARRRPGGAAADEAERERLSALAGRAARGSDSWRAPATASRCAGCLALIAVEVARLAAGRARARGERASGHGLMLEPTGATVEALRKLVEEHFQKERQLAFYADKLAMTVDRLNDHVKRATGVTAGHLIRQRVLTEAKRQLVFTSQPIHEIAYDLAFSDPSHFARFFRKQTGTHAARVPRGARRVRRPGTPPAAAWDAGQRRQCLAVSATISASWAQGLEWLRSRAATPRTSRSQRRCNRWCGSSASPGTGAARCASSATTPACRRRRIFGPPPRSYFPPDCRTRRSDAMVLRSTSRMTAVDQPNSSTPFIAVIGPSSCQRTTGITSP